MSFLIFAGLVSFVSGIMLMLNPKAFVAVARWSNKTAANIDTIVLKYRILIGICLISISAYLWFIACHIKAVPLLGRLS